GPLDSVDEGSSVTGTVSLAAASTTDVVVTLGSSDTTEVTVPGSVTIAAGDTSATFTVTGVEDNLDDGDQTVTITAATGSDSVTGTITTIDDEDTLTLPDTGGTTATGTGFDTITDGAGNDSISAGDQDDSVTLGAGNDTADGGTGNDTVSYEGVGTLNQLGVRVSLAEQGAAQNTRIAGQDVLTGFENVTGSDAVDNLFGDANDNILSGGLSADALTGAGGNDTLFGGAGSDILVGEQGVDVLYGGDDAPNLDRASWRTETQDLFFDFTSDFSAAGNRTTDVIEEDILFGIEGFEGSRSNFNEFDATDQTESFNFFGGNGGNLMYGGDGGDGGAAGQGDGLIGFNGDDTIFGNEGGDIIWGRRGDDILDAGRTTDGSATDGDADQFNFEAASGNDTISNFEVGTDILFFNIRNLDDTSGDGSFNTADLDFDTSNGTDTVVTFTAFGGTAVSTITFLGVDAADDLENNGVFNFVLF
ncbi:MAG: calcium-binding protein, partial [Pseudomonadota bacterium]